VIFKNAVMGRRQGDGRAMPVPDWMQRSWVKAGSTFSVVLLFAFATVFVTVVVCPVARCHRAVRLVRVLKWTPWAV
jgi:hypothetical protein